MNRLGRVSGKQKNKWDRNVAISLSETQVMVSNLTSDLKTNQLYWVSKGLPGDEQIELNWEGETLYTTTKNWNNSP